MENQMNRSILENFEITNNEHSQHEIGKMTSINAMRGIENGSLHFITVPRDQEFIDHSLLNPEYLAQFPNGFIVDLIPNGDGEQHAQQIITDDVGAELAFQGDEQDRRLTAALLQLVNKPCHIKIGNETQVIVSNKDLTLAQDHKPSVISHSFAAVTDQHVLHGEAITDSQFKIYQHQKTHPIQTQANPPLPPLTPIRRLTRQRKNSSVTPQTDIQIFQVNDINVEEEIDNRQQPRQLTKKSLPHKKRISKKLKTIDATPTRQTVIYQDIQQNQVAQDVQFLNSQPQFSCEICSTICGTQLDFFAHLKSHYEPAVVSDAKVENKEEIVVLNQHNAPQHIAFNSFQQTTMDDVKIEHQPRTNLKTEVVEGMHDSTSQHQRDDLQMEVEFSDPEDMLEGIRGVVDKVQESVENDSNDGNDWYSSNSLNANIGYKTEENSQNLNNSVENFSMYFKNNLEKSDENQEIILPVEENETKLIEEHTEIIPDERYDGIETSNEISTTTELPSNSEMDKILVSSESIAAVDENDDDGDVDDEQDEDYAEMEEEKVKIAPKHSQRSRKAKTKAKIFDDDDFSDNTMNAGGISSDEDDKTKKQRRKCLKCDKVFNSSNAFKYHELSHTGERPHQCEVCGKSFFAQSALKVHMRLHSGAKPYECEVCQRAFRQWGDLKYHTISIHTQERNFQCEFCGKAFARRYSLVIHRRIHTCERNYKCEFCPKSFRASSYLQNHRKVHTGEKPYPCPTCGKKFRVSGDLKRHLNIHSREKRKKTDLISDVKIVPSTSTKTDSSLLIDLNLLQDEVGLL